MTEAKKAVRSLREQQAHELQIRFLNFVARAEPRVVVQLARVARRARVLTPKDSPGGAARCDDEKWSSRHFVPSRFGYVESSSRVGDWLSPGAQSERERRE
jgi:hypothetical protein